MANESRVVRATDDTLDELFQGVMIECYDWDVGNHRVPGWQCKKCGWRVGTIGLPPSHICPDDGARQRRPDAP